MLKLLKEKWPILIAINICVTMLFLTYSCEPQVRSITDPAKSVTRAELQWELDALLRLAEIRKIELDKKEHLRTLIMNNAVLIAETGTFNPVGILTALLAFYGAGSAATTGGRAIKKKIIKNAIKPDAG